uniref:Uncharacterized protein LOC111127079 isoform X2 n=1 Tax=Crassostrea virginica TaxID=6565 RepID=A0A8B8DLD3_CRAVI|nr:uncharacterized protein LOC111127079 isoform X2 [Crassostrea virginica]
MMTTEDPITQSGNLPWIVTLAGIPWIVTFLMMFASGPIVYRALVYNGLFNISCNFDDRLTKLNFPETCDFDDSRTEFIWMMVASLAFVNLASLVCMVCTHVFTSDKCQTIFYLTFSICSAVGIAVYCPFFYTSVTNPVFVAEKTDWSDLYNKMKTSLKENYLSDNVSSSFEISNQWNKLFIDYECCGVDRVLGTTNDFDNTPWCTTKGTCQATASQIPRSCCIYLNEFDYHSAPKDCHASVNRGTYYEKGCYSVIKREMKKKRENKREELNRAIGDVLAPATCVCLILASFALWFVSVAVVACSRLCCSKKCPSDPTSEKPTQTNGTTDSSNIHHTTKF